MEEGFHRSKFKKVCVFCGSNSGNRKVFSDAAIDLGHELVKRKIDLVYGGGSVGLMGLISQRVYDGGCHVLGIIPKALMPLEISGEPVGEVRIVSDMHERKATMAREADAFIALPGGYGTMEELLEMITWAQLGIHKKPVGLLNVDGYYNCLLALFDNGVEEGFIKPGARNIVVLAPTAKELMMKMEHYCPSHEHVAPHESWKMERLDAAICCSLLCTMLFTLSGVLLCFHTCFVALHHFFHLNGQSNNCLKGKSTPKCKEMISISWAES